MTDRQIRHVIHSGEVYDTPHVRLHVSPAQSPDSPQVACVVGKRVHAHATVRHRYQRLMREVARRAFPQPANPYDMVWVAKPQILHVGDVSELEQSLAPYLQQLITNSKRKRHE